MAAVSALIVPPHTQGRGAVRPRWPPRGDRPCRSAASGTPPASAVTMCRGPSIGRGAVGRALCTAGGEDVGPDQPLAPEVVPERRGYGASLESHGLRHLCAVAHAQRDVDGAGTGAFDRPLTRVQAGVADADLDDAPCPIPVRRPGRRPARTGRGGCGARRASVRVLLLVQLRGLHTDRVHPDGQRTVLLRRLGEAVLGARTGGTAAAPGRHGQQHLLSALFGPDEGMLTVMSDSIGLAGAPSESGGDAWTGRPRAVRGGRRALKAALLLPT